MNSESKLRLGFSAVAATLATVMIGAEPAAAHGIGGRTDLPLPAWQMAWAAGFAVASSFVILGAFWLHPKLERAAVGRPLRVSVRWSAVVLVVTRSIGLVLFGVVLVAAWWGNENPTVNISGDALYIIFWVGLQLLSAMVGDIWAAFNPLTTIADGAAWIKSRLASSPISPAIDGDGSVWPAVVAVSSFLWLELAYHSSSSPRPIAIFLTVYAIGVLGGASIHGRSFVRRADGFALLFTTISSIAPIFRDDDGRLRVRAPLSGVSTLKVVPGTVGFILVVLGSTTFDGFTRSATWGRVAGDSTRWTLTVINTVGLGMVIGLVALAFLLAVRMMSNVTGESELALSDLFGPSLVTIMVAYTAAHYFSLLVLDGQRIIIQVSDPFGRGWDLFGTKSYAINWALVSTGLIAWAQTTSIAVGHVLAVTAAHDRALGRYDRATAMRSQYPMLGVMLVYTVVGLIILLGAF